MRKRQPGCLPEDGERLEAVCRLDRQADGMSLKAMLDDLLKVCDRSMKEVGRSHFHSLLF